MHWNPCKGNRLAAVPEDYVHSSANFYILHVPGVYGVTNFIELADIDLTGEMR
ncbi:MAG: hypothetical protein M3R72_08800 [Bacteroidota bacterium]|nr:hypothetical protein [Bacteroidota bacterium]